MQSDLGISPERWGWVTGVFAIAYALFEIPTGAMGDRTGPRKILKRIVVWWSAFTTLTGAVSNYFVLLIVRFLFGAGEAGAYPNSSASISRWFPKTERARASGIVWMASRVGGVLTPFIVYPIQARWGWRASFLAFGFLGVIWAVGWYFWYRDTPGEKKGVSKAELEEIQAGQAVTASATHHGLPWAHVLRRGQFWTLLLMYHTYCWGSYFFVSWLHTFLAKGRGFTEGDLLKYSSLPFLFGGCATLLGGLTSDYLTKRIGLKLGRRIVGASGLAFSAIFMISVLFTEDKLASVLLLSLAYAGSDFMLPVSWAVCLDIGRKHAGAVSGSMNMAGQFGSFLSSVAFGYLIKSFGTFNAILPPMAGMLVVSAVLFLLIDPTKELVPEEKGV
jgi:MFS family permease